jgi:hypothetical protein
VDHFHRIALIRGRATGELLLQFRHAAAEPLHVLQRELELLLQLVALVGRAGVDAGRSQLGLGSFHRGRERFAFLFRRAMGGPRFGEFFLEPLPLGGKLLFARARRRPIARRRLSRPAVRRTSRARS